MFGILLVVLVVALMGGGATIAVLHLRLNPVLSGSMRPGIQPGDLAVTGPVDVSTLRPGDVISFFPPGATVAVLHRLLTVDRRDDGTWITTQGDANPVPDAWGEIRLRGDTAWRALGSVPAVGFIPMWTQGLRGPLLVLAGLLIGSIVLVGGRKAGPAMHPSAGGRSPRVPRPPRLAPATTAPSRKEGAPGASRTPV